MCCERSWGATCRCKRVLHQAVTTRADEGIRPDAQHVQEEQESFQSELVSRMLSNATPPQSASLSYDQVYEEMVRGKKSWYNAWLDTQKKPVLVKSRLVVKRVRCASKRKDVRGDAGNLKQ